jgi:hypothetical protein
MRTSSVNSSSESPAKVGALRAHSAAQARRGAVHKRCSLRSLPASPLAHQGRAARFYLPASRCLLVASGAPPLTALPLRSRPAPATVAPGKPSPTAADVRSSSCMATTLRFAPGFGRQQTQCNGRAALRRVCPACTAKGGPRPAVPGQRRCAVNASASLRKLCAARRTGIDRTITRPSMAGRGPGATLAASRHRVQQNPNHPYHPHPCRGENLPCTRYEGWSQKHGCPHICGHFAGHLLKPRQSPIAHCSIGMKEFSLAKKRLSALPPGWSRKWRRLRSRSGAAR